MARQLEPDDGAALEVLHQMVLDTLEHTDLFWVEMEPEEMIATYSGGKGLIIGVFDGAVLVGYGALCLPGQEGPIRGADLLLPESALPQVAHLSSAMVMPDYRGRGLHRWLLDRRVEIAVGLGRSHLLSTAAPRNHRSWGNMVRAGFAIKHLMVVGDGLLRCLVHRDISVTLRFDADEAETCHYADIDRQRSLLAEGYWGWNKGRDRTGQTCLVFGRPVLSAE